MNVEPIAGSLRTYDPELHVYRASSRLPGATDIVKAEGLVDVQWMSEEARWRGQCVHKGLELYNRFELDEDSLDEVTRGYIASYAAFLEKTGFIVVGCEQPVFDDAFACMPDVWGRMNGFDALVEFKTGPIPKWAKIQTALQKRALKTHLGFNAVKRFALQLMPDGSLANLIRFESPRDDYAAMSMVESFHWKLDNGFIRDWK